MFHATPLSAITLPGDDPLSATCGFGFVLDSSAMLSQDEMQSPPMFYNSGTGTSGGGVCVPVTRSPLLVVDKRQGATLTTANTTATSLFQGASLSSRPLLNQPGGGTPHSSNGHLRRSDEDHPSRGRSTNIAGNYLRLHHRTSSVSVPTNAKNSSHHHNHHHNPQQHRLSPRRGRGARPKEFLREDPVPARGQLQRADPRQARDALHPGAVHLANQWQPQLHQEERRHGGAPRPPSTQTAAATLSTWVWPTAIPIPTTLTSSGPAAAAAVPAGPPAVLPTGVDASRGPRPSSSRRSRCHFSWPDRPPRPHGSDHRPTAVGQQRAAAPRADATTIVGPQLQFQQQYHHQQQQLPFQQQQQQTLVAAPPTAVYIVPTGDDGYRIVSGPAGGLM